MLLIHDPACAEYGDSSRPENPRRVLASAAHLRNAHPTWYWRVPTTAVSDDILRLAHATSHLERLVVVQDFDSDTPYFAGIDDHARRSVAAAIEATTHALEKRTPVVSLMRPPGHHASVNRAMGFCYLNQIAIAALWAKAHWNVERIAVWDFDAHHGNGTESILHARAGGVESGILFASVHQSPGYPGTGTRDVSPALRNWPIAPGTSRARHMEALRASFDAVIDHDPDLILVSAGFDAYARDPITQMTLETEDFAALGAWLRTAGRPTAAVLEGGYSPDLPLLIDAFLTAWEKDGDAA